MSFLAHSDAPPPDGRASLSAQSGNGAIITPMRRFPPPWMIEEANDALQPRSACGSLLESPAQPFVPPISNNLFTLVRQDWALASRPANGEYDER